MRKLLLITLVLIIHQTAFTQGSAFTYQGKLTDGGNPANGPYDLTFRLFDQPSGGSQIGSDVVKEDVNVVAGVFTVILDYGPSAFRGQDIFLDISVRPGSSSNPPTVLTPRQKITRSPYAIKAEIANIAEFAASASTANGLSNSCALCVTNEQILSLAGNKLTGVISGDGAGITNINGGNIAPSSITATQLAGETAPGSTQLLSMLRWDLLRKIATFPVGDWPKGIAFDGTNMWIADSSAGTLTKLRASDGAHVGTFPVGNFPSGVAFDGANIWVITVFNSVVKLRALDGAKLGTFLVGSNPQGGIAFDGSNIWVPSGNTNDVTKLRASDGANLGSFPVGASPRGVTFDGSNIWVANQSDNTVTKLRANDGANLGTYPAGSGPIGLIFDGANVWAANLSNSSVTKVRASDGANLGTFPAGNGAKELAFDGSNIWVANWFGGSVTKVRASDGANLGTFSVGTRPEALAFDGGNVWVTVSDLDSVVRLHPAFTQP